MRALVVTLVATWVGLSLTDVFDDYELCKQNGAFGRQRWVCDADGLLDADRTARLEKTLFNIQGRVSCKCANRDLCFRNGGPRDYMAAMVVTSDAKTEGVDLRRAADRIYYDSQIGRQGCNNGMLILYNKDQRRISTYRGSGTYRMVSEREMNQLRERARQDGRSEDEAIGYLLRPDPQEIQRRKSKEGGWSLKSFIGWVLAALAALGALACLYCLCLAFFLKCCCFAERKDEARVADSTGYYRQNTKDSYTLSSNRKGRDVEIGYGTDRSKKKQQKNGDAVYVVPDTTFDTELSASPTVGYVKTPSRGSHYSDTAGVRSEFQPRDLDVDRVYDRPSSEIRIKHHLPRSDERYVDRDVPVRGPREYVRTEASDRYVDDDRVAYRPGSGPRVGEYVRDDRIDDGRRPVGDAHYSRTYKNDDRGYLDRAGDYVKSGARDARHKFDDVKDRFDGDRERDITYETRAAPKNERGFFDKVKDKFDDVKDDVKDRFDGDRNSDRRVVAGRDDRGFLDKVKDKFDGDGDRNIEYDRRAQVKDNRGFFDKVKDKYEDVKDDVRDRFDGDGGGRTVDYDRRVQPKENRGFFDKVKDKFEDVKDRFDGDKDNIQYENRPISDNRGVVEKAGDYVKSGARDVRDTFDEKLGGDRRSAQYTYRDGDSRGPLDRAGDFVKSGVRDVKERIGGDDNVTYTHERDERSSSPFKRAQHAVQGGVASVVGSGADERRDLPFLDPRRAVEVQTKKDYIY